jgi:hypothetical protein
VAWRPPIARQLANEAPDVHVVLWTSIDFARILQSKVGCASWNREVATAGFVDGDVGSSMSELLPFQLAESTTTKVGRADEPSASKHACMRCGCRDEPPVLELKMAGRRGGEYSGCTPFLGQPGMDTESATTMTDGSWAGGYKYVACQFLAW